MCDWIEEDYSEYLAWVDAGSAQVFGEVESRQEEIPPLPLDVAPAVSEAAET